MESAPLENGTRVRDAIFRKDGVIEDCACQYAHPQAKPAYHYLVRWEDGMLQAFGENAFRRGYGLEIVGPPQAD